MDKTFDGNALFEALPSSLKVIINYLEISNYKLVLVGGAVRDFILSGYLPSDLDIEIRHQNSFVGKEWENRLNCLMADLKNKFNLSIEYLPYGVYRFALEQYEVEFSSPRLEIFNEKDTGHSNFSAVLQSDLDFNLAYTRRDFTINAIGAQVDSISRCTILKDPFDGMRAINSKLLIPCGSNFDLDPVRFLRVVRFYKKLNFSFSNELISKLSSFEFEGLSDYYLRSEASKIGYLIYFKELFDIADRFGISFSKNVESLRFLSVIHCDCEFSSIDTFYAFLIFKSDSKSVVRLTRFFSLKKKFVSSLVDMFELLKKVDFQWIKNSCEPKDILDSRFTDFFLLFKIITRGMPIELSFLAENYVVIIKEIIKLNQFDISINLPDSMSKQNIGRYCLLKKMEALWRSNV